MHKVLTIIAVKMLDQLIKKEGLNLGSSISRLQT